MATNQVTQQSAATKKPERKRKPKMLAVINEIGCTGCEACIFFCPVDCIDLIPTKQGPVLVGSICRVDFDRCIGCSLCAQYCPWETIHMVPFEKVMGEA